MKADGEFRLGAGTESALSLWWAVVVVVGSQTVCTSAPATSGNHPTPELDKAKERKKKLRNWLSSQDETSSFAVGGRDVVVDAPKPHGRPLQ